MHATGTAKARMVRSQESEWLTMFTARKKAAEFPTAMSISRLRLSRGAQLMCGKMRLFSL